MDQESPSADRFAEAIERRLSTQQSQAPSPATLLAEHARRQKFRRMIDPGILRPNPEQEAVASMKILYKLSENLIREPENPKFQRIKSTNAQIQKHIINLKGTVEFLRELGFHPEVDNFQPFFVFNPKRMSDLVIGSAMLKESLDLQEQKRARATESKQTVQEARAEVIERVHLAFMEDRRTKMELDEREKELRTARAQVSARQGVQERARRHSTDSSGSAESEGSGHILGAATDQPPPPYH
ncbi:hypothetical protein EV361DRAFT_58290 [Lentinula raphanica]|uniref:PUB domain-containing protein n=1 Tax=Lentinula raphanica TaxID=153919 RepID=A0AA38PLY7_9AGAR|nr:hypothetical protein F5878DRAFT_600171 [Lentinula raphanica]KAJ3977358.1 hypothetical protein EV361DRAFT_58290 [Lentinula raphanica]